MSPSGAEYLRHILDEADFVLKVTSGLSFEVFVADETLKRAVVRSLEIIGEASKKVPQAVKLAHPEVEWKAAAGLRDRLIHDYFGVDYEIVWDVATTRLPGLRGSIERVLEESGEA